MVQTTNEIDWSVAFRSASELFNAMQPQQVIRLAVLVARDSVNHRILSGLPKDALREANRFLDWTINWLSGNSVIPLWATKDTVPDARDDFNPSDRDATIDIQCTEGAMGCWARGDTNGVVWHAVMIILNCTRSM